MLRVFSKVLYSVNTNAGSSITRISSKVLGRLKLLVNVSDVRYISVIHTWINWIMLALMGVAFLRLVSVIRTYALLNVSLVGFKRFAYSSCSVFLGLHRFF